MQGYARQGLGRSVSHKKSDKQGLPLAASLTVRARLGSLRRTVCRTRSAPRNDRSRGLTLPHRGFANASTDANGKNDRTNCNQEIFHGAPQCCRAVCTASKSPCGCISATHSQLRRGRPHAKEIAGKSLRQETNWGYSHSLIQRREHGQQRWCRILAQPNQDLATPRITKD